MTTRVSVFGLGNVGQALLRSFGRIRGGAALVLATDGRGVFLGEDLDPAQVIERKLARDYDRPARRATRPRSWRRPSPTSTSS